MFFSKRAFNALSSSWRCSDDNSLLLLLDRWRIVLRFPRFTTREAPSWASQINSRLSAASRHDASGLLDIFQYLFAQSLRIGKLLLVAEAPEEYYFHFSGGQLLGEIEEVRFDGELVAVKGGTDADVCDGPVDSWAENGGGGVNAIFRQRLLLGGEI